MNNFFIFILNIELLIKLLSIYFLFIYKRNENYLNIIFKNAFNIKTISIIIPIFNKEEYLENCFDSVRNQTLKNIEIICINDGSNDNSSNIIKAYSKLDNRFIFLNQTNKGSAFSRNRGIKYSKGKFISFLDSDDLYYDKIFTFYKNLPKEKIIWKKRKIILIDV